MKKIKKNNPVRSLASPKQKELKALRDIAEKTLDLMKRAGITASEVAVALEDGFTIAVRKGNVDTIEYHRDKGVGITVFNGYRFSTVSTSDTSLASIENAISYGVNIVKYIEEDPCVGLAEAHLMATELADLDLYHPWDIPVEHAVLDALACEKRALAFDSRVKASDGVMISTHKSYYVYGNSHGFMGECPSTCHAISCALIAEQDGQMERDYSVSIACAFDQLDTFDAIAKDASVKTVKRLGSRKLESQKAPIIFEAEVARGLLISFIAAIHGGNLYKKSSFLVDHLGKPVFSKKIHIYEDPFIPRSLGSATFDNEGVRTRRQDFVKEGILTNYVLNSFTARKLGLETTGNAGGVHNLFISHDDMDLNALLKKMHKGLFVTELIGNGENLVTGDFSKGAAGFWVEEGKIQFPVSEVTIAGNLRDMFLNIVAVANDINCKSTIKTGSILIDSMMVGGD